MTDPAIIEAAARALQEETYNYHSSQGELYRKLARAALSVAAPFIEAAALERAAQAFEPDEDGHDAHNYRWKVKEIAAAIRALIAKDSGGGD